MMQPATLIKWHRAGFRKYWTWRSRPRGGRPAIDPQIRALIRRMATANMWGAPMCTGDARRACVGTRNRERSERSAASFSSSASGCPKRPCRSTCRVGASRRLRLGARFWTITWTRSCPWTSSRCRRRSSTSCTCSSSSPITVGASCISTSPAARQRHGRRNRSPTPSHGTRRLATCCVTAMASMAPSSEIA